MRPQQNPNGEDRDNEPVKSQSQPRDIGDRAYHGRVTRAVGSKTFPLATFIPCMP